MFFKWFSLAHVGFFATFLSLVLAGIAWKKRSIRGASWYFWIACMSSIWLFSSSFHLIETTFPAKNFWSKTQYIGIVFLPVFWLFFTLQYTRQDAWLKRGKRFLFFLPPLFTLFLVWTNDWHLLIWKTSSLKTYNASISTISRTYGLGFAFHSLFTYVLVITSCVLLFRYYRKVETLYKRQVRILLMSAMFPLIGNVCHLVRFNPIQPLDITPFAFFLSLLVWAWGLFRHQLMDLLPIARETIFENIQEGIMVLDANKRIIDCNPTILHLLNLQRQEMIGKSIPKLLPSLKRLLALDSFLEKKTEIIEVKTKTFEIHFSPLKDSSEDNIGFVLLFHDISERIASERWKQEQEKEKALLEAQRIFLTRMSHELRTPLNAIIGFSELLQEDFQDAGLHAYFEDLQKIRTSGFQLLDFVDSTLLMKENPSTKTEVFLLSLLLEPLLQETKEYDTQNSLCFVSLLPPEFEISGDPEKIKTCLHKILQNAFRFSNHGKVCFTVKPQIIDTKEWIAFVIQDFGIGISQEMQKSVFEPFVQQDPSQTRKFDGAGMGLAVVDKYCKQMKGQILLSSQEGEGSIFTLLLPLNTDVLEETT